MKNTFRFSILPIILSLVFSIAWIFIGGLLYNLLVGILWTPLLIALYMTGLALTLFLAIIVSNALGNNAKPRSSGYTRTLITIGAIFLCTMLFEFLYELNPIVLQPTEPTSYIFLIDDSGSMEQNDPHFIRNDAIYDVLQDRDYDFPYAVYSFESDCRQISPMAKAGTAVQKNYGFVSNGLTDILGAIRYVLKDIDNGVLDGGASPRIILLSDGASDQYGYNGVMSDCIKRNVSISTVGIGSADSEFLQRIAEDTRGTFVWVNDISQLTNAMTTAANTFFSYSRNLLDYRPFVNYDALFAVLRIVFMLILAAGFVLIKVFMFSTFDSKNIALISFIALAAIGALGLEIGINILHVDSGYMRAIMCVFFALLLGSAKVAEVKGNGGDQWNNSLNTGSMGGGFAGASDKWKF